MYVLICISNKKAAESGSLVDVLIADVKAVQVVKMLFVKLPFALLLRF